MESSFSSLITTGSINILTLAILLWLVTGNTAMHRGQIRAYAAVVVMTILVVAAEGVTCVCGLLDADYRGLHLLANAVGFAISLWIPLILAIVFNESFLPDLKWISVPVAVVTLMILASPWTGWIFWVSEDNRYTRGPVFWIYILAYGSGMMILLMMNYLQSLQYDKKERLLFWALSVILLAGTTIQVVLPQIYTTWHCVTIVLVLYYLYLRELQFKYDAVTGVLNRHAFEDRLASLRKQASVGIVLFDLDEFKEINDTCGHAEGDVYLKNAAQTIKSSFQKIGTCYRIGGDEFCVLAPQTDELAIRLCRKQMLRQLAHQHTDRPSPMISCGYSFYCRGEGCDIQQVMQQADENMYRDKREKKSSHSLVH